MAAYTTTTIRPKYHQAIIDWQKRNFPEIDLLIKNWDRYFKGQTPFQLTVKIGELQSDAIEYGRFAGMKKIEHAGEMPGNMFYTARDIIKAQCSTELGSIQQHRLTLDDAISDEARFAILRIMAEELRHAYQMFWVLEHDPSWKKPAHGDVAEQTIELLLGMELGTHVLDAFNIEFFRFLDNIIYTAVIDLVGKYQLEMQKVFSYAPVARSMGPMLVEEAFHLGTGRKTLKQIAINATQGKGDYSISDIQRCLNQWYPRGLEMFGNEKGGETAVAFGFKDRTNGQAQSQYIEEVRSIVENTNVAILQTRIPGIEGREARQLAREIIESNEVKRGVAPEDLIFLPNNLFFRKRGPEEVIFQPYDLHGRLLTKDGKPYSAEEYVDYLRSVLPDRFVASREFQKYKEQMVNYRQWQQSSGFALA